LRHPDIRLFFKVERGSASLALQAQRLLPAGFLAGSGGFPAAEM
jgi:hypothetical protein